MTGVDCDITRCGGHRSEIQNHGRLHVQRFLQRGERHRWCSRLFHPRLEDLAAGHKHPHVSSIGFILVSAFISIPPITKMFNLNVVIAFCFETGTWICNLELHNGNWLWRYRKWSGYQQLFIILIGHYSSFLQLTLFTNDAQCAHKRKPNDNHFDGAIEWY